MKRFALLAMLLVACEREARPVSDSSTAGASPTPAVARESAAINVAAAPARPVCLATGSWSSCAIFERLDRSGLAPIRDSAVATEEPLQARGQLLKLGRGELELYIYESASSRERDQARLDASKYVVYPAPMPMRPVPTLITSANLIAILHSRNDHLRERVSDAITAGPPQPSPIRP